MATEATPDLVEPEVLIPDEAPPGAADEMPTDDPTTIPPEEPAAASAAEDAEPEPAPPPPPPKRTMVDILRDQLADKEKQLHDYIAAYKDAKRDMDERMARTKRDREKVIDRDRKQLVGSLLEVLDNLDRSIAAMADSAGIDGLRMVHRQFSDVLVGFGVERMSAMGTLFDAKLHEAIGVVPAHGGQRDQEIMHVDRAGYLFKGELLRPARVVIASAP
ncbi:MAG: nucleotide exchange factor GrpE [Deltaproteobacteria bacterium]|nr:nucleotide exchange factor GrpE [Deltaproteobacteria bacterium]